MLESKAKVPLKSGLATARQKLKALRIKKSPSPELVKIIDEATHQAPEEQDTQNKESPKKDDIAAHSKKRSQDLDL